MPPKKGPQTRSMANKALTEKKSNTRAIDPPANPKAAKSQKSEQQHNHTQASKVASTSGAAGVINCSHVEEATGKSSSKIWNNDNNNNRTDEIDPELGDKIKLMLQPVKMTPKRGYTEDDLKSFLASSTFKSVDLATLSTAQLFQRFIDATSGIDELTLVELIDHYHLGILMQSYKPMETDCMGYRSELLDAVSKLCIDLPPDGVEFIGTVLCDRFVIGKSMERLDKVVQMQQTLSMLIIKDDFSCQIAMSILMATFVKVSGVPRKHTNTDIITEVFEMVKLVDWMQMSNAGSVADLFVLVRSFSLIINTHHNQKAHADWNKGTSSKIQEYFLRVLRTVRCVPNYGLPEMMVQSYICAAFNCISQTNAMGTSISMEM
ncbi:uncharacterized protein LOC6566001 isoform X2 [Drosophila grimshawi]|uniref:uncharacterized protein LOC6566001 isoform X2 n=1 Tax=Drosophila grimshawi TaxID=7222 RepID=UPI000C86F974|nr:uncharacterized protein LOC6566001 isoform X2 [Drosophila grimshawi]